MDQKIPSTPPLPEEALVRVLYNGREALNVLCSPRDLRELAVGWLFAEGYLQAPEEIVTCGACVEMRAVSVNAAPDRWAEISRRPRVLTSGCGQGVVSWIRPAAHQSSGNGFRPDRGLLRRMLATASEYHRTGGIHCAALAGEAAILFQSEDIGRHNAVDKVIGWGFLNGAPFDRLQLLTTGRVSAEMILKAARAGISAVASLSIPTTLAVELARTAGISLVGRAAGKRPVIC